MAPSSLLWLRVASAAGALGIVLVLRSVLAPAQTEPWSYLFVTTFGYGHLLGASLGSRRGASDGDHAASALRAAFIVTSLASVYAAFTGVVAAAPWVVLPMLYASIWHIAENDLAIGRGQLDAPALPFPRSPRQHALALSLSGALALLAARSGGAPAFDGVPTGVEIATWLAIFAPGLLLFASEPRSPRGALGLGISVASAWLAWQGAPWVRFWEVFAAVTCFHLIEWLLVVGAKARARGELRRASLRMLAFHLPAVAVCAAAFGGGDSLSWLQRAFSPGGYLLFSLLHVAHTAALRLKRAPVAAAVRAAA